MTLGPIVKLPPREDVARAHAMVTAIAGRVLDDNAEVLGRCALLAVALADGAPIEFAFYEYAVTQYTIRVQCESDAPPHAQNALRNVTPASPRGLLAHLRARAATAIALHYTEFPEWAARIQHALDETAASDAEIDALRSRAGKASDFDVVRLCERAIAGDLTARRACGYIIAVWLGGRP